MLSLPRRETKGAVPMAGVYSFGKLMFVLSEGETPESYVGKNRITVCLSCDKRGPHFSVWGFYYISTMGTLLYGEAFGQKLDKPHWNHGLPRHLLVALCTLARERKCAIVIQCNRKRIIDEDIDEKTAVEISILISLIEPDPIRQPKRYIECLGRSLTRLVVDDIEAQVS